MKIVLLWDCTAPACERYKDMTLNMKGISVEAPKRDDSVVLSTFIEAKSTTSRFSF